jgi:hypothetical protein
MRPQRQKTLLARDHIMALQLQHKWTFRTIAGASSTAERKANKATKAANAARKLSAVPPVDLKMSATGEGEVAPSPGLEHKWLPHAAAPPEPHAGGKRKHPVGGYAEVAARRHPAADAPRAADGAAHPPRSSPTLSDRQIRYCSAPARAPPTRVPTLYSLPPSLPPSLPNRPRPVPWKGRRTAPRRGARVAGLAHRAAGAGCCSGGSRCRGS